MLYGCGGAATLRAGGLAVVGSRNVPETLIEYAEDVGRLAASAGRSLVSGGARGVDRAAMRGALDAGGRAAGVLADGLERAATLRENREALMDGRLVLTSPYDPAARFHVGQAMQRNKLIYALSDAALVVSSDHETGGTWAGAVEQLDKLKLVPVHVRADGEMGKGLEGLLTRGARRWPEPATPEVLEAFWMRRQTRGTALRETTGAFDGRGRPNRDRRTGSGHRAKRRRRACYSVRISTPSGRAPVEEAPCPTT